MPTLKELLVAEATEYEFKSALETNRPKSWLKTVSAYANGQGAAKISHSIQCLRSIR
jgi:hypothetical protein